MMNRFICICIGVCLAFTAWAQQPDIVTITSKNGTKLGYSKTSGVKIIMVDGENFKDLNRNGELDKYEDWRLPAAVRAEDLAKKMTIEQIAGLMLYSGHQAIPANPAGFSSGTYNGKSFPESEAAPYELSDQQKKFLKEDNLRHVLITTVKDPETAARWNNVMQAYVEGLDWGIPGNTSSDPRHNTSTSAEYNASGGIISLWPDNLGMAATFDPVLEQQFGEIAAKEYRALGITTALSPQIDLATEPRWNRFSGTFGEDPELDTDMARAYIDGFQTSHGGDEIVDGWGYGSVNAMVKHWPGGGPEEGGRDAHFAHGKFAVYPGNNLETHIKPFVEGAFNLKGKTGKASAVMPYYTISYNQDVKYGQNVGNSFSKYIITDLLRHKYQYDGVVCTDWMITADEGTNPGVFSGKSWGVEAKTVAQRHYDVLMAGVDQFGGNNDKEPVIEAYHIGVKEHGEDYMRARFEQSASRLLVNIFRVGLFENPYLDPEQSATTVGNPEFMKAGYEAQLKSIVLLKNAQSVLPVAKGKKVYVPKVYRPSKADWWGNLSQPALEYPVSMEMIKKYYDVTENPEEADLAIVFVDNPTSLEDGYDYDDRLAGGNGYLPISLQYGTYTAVDARGQSLAAGDPVVDPTISNRSYKNKTATVWNTMDLRTILDTKAMMKGKPVIVSVTAGKPMVFNEFESAVDGIVLNFGVSTQAIMDIISGKTEPSGLLPVQMPADMKTVEEQYEDVPHDMKCHIDSEGHRYDFGYGLNWKGVIQDGRNAKYSKNSALCAQAADSLAFESRVYTADGQLLPYRIMFPKDYDSTRKYPLVVFLHGAGERGNDNTRQLLHGGQWLVDNLREKHPVIVIVPQCPEDDYWAKVKREVQPEGSEMAIKFTFYKDSTATSSLNLLMGLIRDWEKSGKIDTKRIYAGGLSMGGMGTYELITRMPGTFAAAFVICGAVNLDWLTAHNRTTPLWLFHGSEDQVVDVNYSREAYKKLNDGKRVIKYTEYPGINHNSWDNVFKEPGVFDWLFSYGK